MNCYLLILETERDMNYFTAEKRIFAKKEQATKVAINSFFSWIDENKQFYEMNVIAQVCHFLKEHDNIPLLIKLIQKEFGNSFRFQIDEIKLEGHVMG
jgi:hypothetical protein